MIFVIILVPQFELQPRETMIKYSCDTFHHSVDYLYLLIPSWVVVCVLIQARTSLGPLSVRDINRKERASVVSTVPLGHPIPIIVIIITLILVSLRIHIFIIIIMGCDIP